jgi:hypothetical protein
VNETAVSHELELEASRRPSSHDRALLLRLADLTLADFFRQLARHGEGGRIAEEDGLLLFAGSHPHPNPYRNGAIRLDDRLTATEAIDRARRFFAPLGRSYVVWVREGGDDLEELCRSRSMPLLEPNGLPELFLEGLPTETPVLGDDVLLRRATEPAVRRDYLDVVAQGWGMSHVSTELASKLFFHPDSMGDPNVIAFVAYVDGRPASGCMALLSHGIAMGGNAATATWAAARHRGLAAACYAACLQIAHHEYGVRASVCQSSSAGAGAWTGMGYQPLTRYLRFLSRPQAGPAA